MAEIVFFIAAATCIFCMVMMYWLIGKGADFADFADAAGGVIIIIIIIAIIAIGVDVGFTVAVVAVIVAIAVGFATVDDSKLAIVIGIVLMTITSILMGIT